MNTNSLILSNKSSLLHSLSHRAPQGQSDVTLKHYLVIVKAKSLQLFAEDCRFRRVIRRLERMGLIISLERINIMNHVILLQ